MIKIYLIRHGETLWNKSLRYQGHSDIPLSDKGRQQAKLLAQRLAGEEIHAFYASDLSRAYETAEIIAGPHGKPVQQIKEFRETKFGKWEGLTFNEIMEQFGDIMTRWREAPLTTRIPDGETLQEVKDRCTTALESILKKHPEQNVVIVAHGGIIRVLIGSILGMDLNKYWKIKQDNVALNIIEFYDEKGILCLMNDTNHLNGLKE